jgi:hypothetical protein
MSAPTSTTPVFDPAVPMTPEFRSDLAWRLAQGWTWEELGETLNCNRDELRRATENDPEFAAVQERAWTRVIWEAEADGMRRLRKLADNGDGERALRASEVLVKYAAERRDNDTRLAIEKMCVEARIEVEKLKNERAAAKEVAKEASRKAQEDNYFPPTIRPAPETDEERAKRFEREHAERAAVPEAEVYLWGGKHPLGQSFPPDASDIRVRVEDDWSCGYGLSRSVVYWITPYKQRTKAEKPQDPNVVEALQAALVREETPGISA